MKNRFHLIPFFLISLNCFSQVDSTRLIEYKKPIKSIYAILRIVDDSESLKYSKKVQNELKKQFERRDISIESIYAGYQELTYDEALKKKANNSNADVIMLLVQKEIFDPDGGLFELYLFDRATEELFYENKVILSVTKGLRHNPIIYIRSGLEKKLVKTLLDTLENDQILR